MITMTEPTLGAKGLFSLAYCSPSKEVRTELTQGRNLEAGAGAEALEGAADWHALFGLLCLLSYRTQDHLPRGAPPIDSHFPAP